MDLRPSLAFLLEKSDVDEKRGTDKRRSHRPVRLIGPVDAVNVLLETTLKPQTFFNVWYPLKYQFSSISPFWDHKFESCIVQKVSMGTAYYVDLQ